MCGSGTTIDVCSEENREVYGFDLVSRRPDIKEADARNLPLPENLANLIFIDSPYSDNIKCGERLSNADFIQFLTPMAITRYNTR